MSGLSFGLGTKRGPSHRAPSQPKKPITVHELFGADSDDEEEQPQPQQQRSKPHHTPAQPASQPQSAQPVKRPRWDAPAPIVPPNDPEVKKAADKLAEFVAKHGRNFEDVTRQRNPGDTMFKFLFDKNCPDYKYYESKIQELSMAAPAAAVASVASAPPPLPPQPASRPLPPPPSTTRAPGFSHAPPPPPNREEPEKQFAKQALAVGNSLAAMDAYMQLAAKKDKPQPEDEDRSQPLLNDNAFERRKVVAVFKDDGSRGHHMQDFIPPEELARFMAKAGDQAAAAAAEAMQHKNALTEDNIGHKLLQKMGWKQGEGIGGTQKGITAPVAASGIKQDNLGLGAAAVHEVEQGDDMYEQYRKRMMLGYKYRPNPLGNPRKAYY